MSKNKTWGLIAGGSLAAMAAGYFVWKNRRLALVSDVTTGESAAYPELRSRVYYADAAWALTAAEQALRRLPRWKLLSRDAENDALEAEVTSPFAPLAGDVTIYVISLGHGQVRVTIRARSRTGKGDLGRNAARIRELQQAMDDRLNSEAAF